MKRFETSGAVLLALPLLVGHATAGEPPQEVEVQEASLLASDGAPYDELGFAVALSGDVLVAGAPKHTHSGLFQAGAAYVYRRQANQWVEEAKLTAADATFGDRFGKSVAVDGDTIVVGSPMRDGGGQDTGGAYVFERAGTSWVQRAVLVAGDAGAFDHLGTAVAIAGDTLAVGAPFDDDGGPESGSAYVFRLAGTTWAEEGKLTASNAAGGDRFAKALDVDGDRLLVGAEYGAGAGPADSGSAYVFERTGTAWSETALLTGSNPETLGEFGATVGLSGDLLVVGAPEHGFQGNAYVFLYDGTSWNEDAQLQPLGVSSDSRFAHAVACDGSRIFVGQPYDSQGLASGGSCHLFLRRPDRTYETSLRIVAAETDHSDLAGSAVALDGNRFAIGAPEQGSFSDPPGGASVWAVRPAAMEWYVEQALRPAIGFWSEEVGVDLDLSGDTLLVGAPGHDVPANNAGAAHVFRRSGTSWIQEVKLAALDPTQSAELGRTVALQGDTAAVGAPGAVSFLGAVYVFRRTGTIWAQEAKLTNDVLAYEDFAETSIDLDGDTLVVGAQGGTSTVGNAHVFVRSGTSWSMQATLSASDVGGSFDKFGQAVAIDGDTALVGAPQDDPYSNGEGSVYVFRRTGTTWVETQKLISSFPTTGGGLGAALDVDGDWAFGGAPFFDAIQGEYTGAVYVYRRSGGLFSEVALLLASESGSDDRFGDRFGASVALDGARAIVGAPFHEIQPNQDEAGRAYVFERFGTTWYETARVASVFPRFDGQFGAAVDIEGDRAAVSEPYTTELLPQVAPAYVVETVERWPSFCDAGDGSLAACPCGNAGAPDAGCDLSQSTGGVSLGVLVQDLGPPNRAVLTSTGYPTGGSAPFSLALRSTGLDPSAPLVFGDGVRCVGVPIVRLEVVNAANGSALHEIPHNAGAGTFFYQVWFRNLPAMFCTPEGFNLSNGRTITW